LQILSIRSILLRTPPSPPRLHSGIDIELHPTSPAMTPLRNLQSSWCGLLLRIRRTLFNRRFARSLRTGIRASGAPATHHRRGRGLLRRGCCVYPAYGPVCNTALFEGPFCKMLA
jgi:hypothetical protein